MIKSILDKFFAKKTLINSDNNNHYKAYYQSRAIANKKHLCHAPFNNMYFNSLGDVANCWLTFDDPEKYSEDRTIKEIWLGEKFSKLRENIKQQNLDARCKTCKKYLENGNYVNVLAKAYDNEYPLSDYPTMMEFELSNTCNLECTMCTGLLSSSIRANREKLPKLISPYGQKFVDELEEFIPYLHEARFNGGEPFLIKIYFDIWERILKLNPSCKIVVATNGTTLNSRIKDVMNKGNFHFNISIDSLIPERYAEIRVNGKLDKVLENFEYFKTYCQEGSRSLCIMINPMRTNWEEMPNFVDFCNKHNVHLWFNSIIHPEDQAIWNLSHEKLYEIYSTLSKVTFKSYKIIDNGKFKYNTSTYYNLVENQIKTWMLEAKGRFIVNQPEESESNKEFFLKNIHDYCNNIENGYDLKIKMEDILQQMESKIGYPQHIDTFYKLIASAPIETTIENMINYDIDTAFQKFREYQNGL